mgnify:CR=1 FL=1|jgi:hypothetical protein|tara:strand:- start:4427 stop:4618 length:192 start_codon:yes stop_codon:yes gene_type:complete
MKKINDWYDNNRNNNPRKRYQWNPDYDEKKKIKWEKHRKDFETFLENEDKKETELERRLDRKK